MSITQIHRPNKLVKMIRDWSECEMHFKILKLQSRYPPVCYKCCSSTAIPFPREKILAFKWIIISYYWFVGNWRLGHDDWAKYDSQFYTNRGVLTHITTLLSNHMFVTSNSDTRTTHTGVQSDLSSSPHHLEYRQNTFSSWRSRSLIHQWPGYVL